MIPFWNPGSAYAFGSTIDSLMNCCSGSPTLCASGASLSRSGPTVPLEPAGAKVWQLAQPLFAKTALPEAPPDDEPSCFCWPFAHVRNFCEVMTCAAERMTAWPSPQSSVQITGNVPCRSGVITRVVTIPGTASSFWLNSGTQKECVTSSDVIRSLVVTSIGSLSVAEVSLPKPGYWKLQANCCAVTSTTSGVSLSDEAAEACGMCSFLARTTALTIEIAVTRTAGTAVHTISRPVLPWIGGPSASSPGCARNLKIA